jgi:hypothetical protein
VSDFIASPTVSEFMRSNADNRIIIGPLGSGKSSACVVEILRRAQAQQVGPKGKRRTRAAVIRNTYRELTDTTKATMDEWLPADIAQWVESDMTYHIRFNDVECEVLLRALDRPDDVKKLLSLDLTFAWINEAKEIPKSVFDMLQGRVGRYPSPKDGDRITWCGIWMDSNPPDSDHWIYKLFEEFDKIDLEDRENFRVFHQPSGLAPNAENIQNLLGGARKKDGRPLYYAKMMPGKTKAWLDAFVHGRYSFVSDGKAVYPEYNDEVHTAKTELEWRKGLLLYLGMDFGLTPAILVAQRLPGLLQWQVLDEITSDDMGAMRFGKHAAQYLKSTYPGAEVPRLGRPLRRHALPGGRDHPLHGHPGRGSSHLPGPHQRPGAAARGRGRPAHHLGHDRPAQPHRLAAGQALPPGHGRRLPLRPRPGLRRGALPRRTGQEHVLAHLRGRAVHAGGRGHGLQSLGLRHRGAGTARPARQHRHPQERTWNPLKSSAGKRC